MYKFSLILIFFLLSITVFAQTQTDYAVITDKDGYVNVREEADINSDIVGIVKEDEVFWVGEEEYGNGWVYVSFLQPKERLVKESLSTEILDARILCSGYMHSSRVRHLNEVEGEYMMNMDTDTDYFMFNDSLSVYMSIGKFNQRDSLKYNGVWGTDLSMPEYQINEGYFEVRDKRFTLDVSGFYEPNFETINFIYDEEMDGFLVTMVNSDGAGYYLCVWQVSIEGKVVRYAFKPY